ncbi:hypothetical protein [Burkholderia multivorans]|uniref:hypothetical protein n=1 Tax=Burkholderia multivorans TaxID=87883 RepID=UPI00057DC74E|nr:hypothetical protein [Burkholderia multivorans]KHS09446.1 hypothetical protein BMD20_29725 [Burkholderia multivorans]KHS10357.1 hypothetical protein BMD22_28100 [Burkholderia multivorans]MDR9229998.1 hypothetical protein [Burkholderia multivorans]HDR9474360.1 hypothetical protein [Burkholderia multivorans]HDR9480202.1 hypothetical protein [Burkholderia multivorans]
MNAKTEAIANADAHLNDADLPTYSELAATLRAMAEVGKPALADLPNLSPELKAQKAYAAYLGARDILGKLDAA